MSKLLSCTAVALALTVTAASVTSSATTGLVATDFNSLGVPGSTALPALTLDLLIQAKVH